MREKRRLRKGALSFALAVIMIIGTLTGIVPGTVTSVKAANTTTVTLDSSNLGNINLNTDTAGQTISSSKIGGITVSITSSGKPIEFYGNPSFKYHMDVNGTGFFTFASSIGNIKKIVITAQNISWYDANAGWSKDGSTFVWSGTPSETVTLTGEGGSNIGYISSIVFTIELPTVTSNVTLNTNGGTINSGNVTTYEEGTGAALPTDITRDGYTFAGWYDNEDLTGNAITEISATDTDDKEYWAKWTPITYTITYENISGATNPNTITSYTIESDTINFANPTKTGYTGSWDITSIPKGSTGNKTITAVWEINKYTVTFKDYNGTVLKTQENVEYNTSATAPANPTRDGYTFTGWDKEFTNITEDTTVTATYSVNSYTVTWTNYDDSVLKKDTVNYGETPEYTGATPTKPATAEYTYTFVGWTPTINAVTGDVTYKATYTDAVNSYTVKWLNYDNTVLQEETVDYGVTPKYTGDTPTKPADEQYTYTFLNWTPVVIPVVDNVVYIATYTNTVNKYTIKFVDEDGTEISSKEYDYGTSANDIVKPDDPTKDATAEYTYKFAGWDSEVTDVTGNKTYKATYTQTEIKKDDGEKAVSTEVKKDEKSPEVKAANLTDEFAESTLSNEEKADIEDAINNGEDVKVDVYLEIEDISDTISASDKEKIKASVTNADNIEYFDISLFKEISISGRSQGAASIHDLTTPLKLTIGVPKSFPAVADGYTRTYKVLRLHDGSVTVLPTTLNADGTLSFETDKFSTYALAYTDTKKEEVTTETPTTETSTTETPTTEAPTTKVDTPTTEAPKADTPKAPTTGDKINLGVIIMLMIDSAMAGLYLTLRRRLMK